MVAALDGAPEAVLALILIGLFVLNAWQTRHFDARMGQVDNRVESVEERVKRTETYLMESDAGPAMADGGREVEEQDDAEEPEGGA